MKWATSPFPNATDSGELNDEEKCPEVKEWITVKKIEWNGLKVFYAT